MIKTPMLNGADGFHFTNISHGKNKVNELWRSQN
jgi:hypothetical protein